MRSTTFLSAFLAGSIVSAVPVEDSFNAGVVEHVVFKRDAVLDARDLELADLHGVNTTEMTKHSVIKRADGDDYTVWVHRSFVEVELPEDGGLEKRQSARLDHSSFVKFHKSPDTDRCGTNTWYGHTGPSSPTTGGPHAIVRWANSNPSYFEIPREDARDVRWHTLVIGGSNTGNNARFSVKRLAADSTWTVFIGSDDIRYQTSKAITDYQRQFADGSWRVEASGGGRCDYYRGPADPHPDRPWVNWEIRKTEVRV